MTMPNSQQPSVTKLPKGQFKCFQCRKVYAQKDGDWVQWKRMEVHLCKTCDLQTKNRPERRDDR